MTRAADNPDSAVLAAFALAPDSAAPAPSGLINRTWYVRSLGGEPLVLQRVNAIFPPEVNEDIDALTAHLAARGMTTPRIVPAASGARWLAAPDGGTWRVLTYVDGITRHAVESAAQAAAAGRVLAQFHRAVADFAPPFKNARLGVHDTERHLGVLRAALTEHTEHPERAAVRPLAARVLALAAALPALPPAVDRIVHGDPKISNILFAREAESAVCLIDLDTLARMPIALELGDAFRSWCNPAAEDAATAGFSQPLFAAAVEGYANAAAGFLEPAEWSAIPAATLTIAVELAARFCADSLYERYFAWDAARYPSASAHNQARTRNQIQVAENVLAALPSMQAATGRAFR